MESDAIILIASPQLHQLLHDVAAPRLAVPVVLLVGGELPAGLAVNPHDPAPIGVALHASALVAAAGDAVDRRHLARGPLRRERHDAPAGHLLEAHVIAAPAAREAADQ